MRVKICTSELNSWSILASVDADSEEEDIDDPVNNASGLPRY